MLMSTAWDAAYRLGCGLFCKPQLLRELRLCETAHLFSATARHAVDNPVAAHAICNHSVCSTADLRSDRHGDGVKAATMRRQPCVVCIHLHKGMGGRCTSQTHHSTKSQYLRGNAAQHAHGSERITLQPGVLQSLGSRQARLWLKLHQRAQQVPASAPIGV